MPSAHGHRCELRPLPFEVEFVAVLVVGLLVD